MGGCRCSYKNCVRATKNSEKDFHFFHYPVRDPTRCLKWITNAKKPNFQNLPEDQLRNKVVCQLHFELQFFSNTSRKRLVHDAVPTLDAGSEDTIQETETNVHVLQTDREGNVFTVDTENLMQTEVRDVTSYIFKNGNLIPADLSDNEIIQPKIYACVNKSLANIPFSSTFVDKPCKTSPPSFNEESGKTCIYTTSMDFSELPNDQVKIEEASPKIEQTTPKMELQESTIEINVTELIKEAFINNQDTLSNEEPISNEEPVPHNQVVQNNTNELLVQNNIQDNSDMEVVNLSQTIRQHTKEIACLKRILNTKTKNAKCRKRLTNTQIINSLHGVIPSSLHAAVSLHFRKDNNFRKSEKNFLVTLYKASPAAYDILRNDLKWKLPNTDTVKQLISSRYSNS